MTRRFPAPWTLEEMPGAFKVVDATGQAIAYTYCRDSAENADAAKALTPDEARRIAANHCEAAGAAEEVAIPWAGLIPSIF